MTTSEKNSDRDDRTENNGAEDAPTEQLSVDEATQELPVPDATAQLPVQDPPIEPAAGGTSEVSVDTAATGPIEITEPTEPTVASMSSGTSDTAPLDWRTAEFASDRSSGNSSSGDGSSARSTRNQGNGDTTVPPAASARTTTTTGARTGQPSGASTDRPIPTLVWTASSSGGTSPDAVDPTSTPHRPESPARGVRVGQLIWAGIVILLGVFLIALALLPNLDVTTALIGLVALLGVALIIAAWATSRRPKV